MFLSLHAYKAKLLKGVHSDEGKDISLTVKEQARHYIWISSFLLPSFAMQL